MTLPPDWRKLSNQPLFDLQKRVLKASYRAKGTEKKDLVELVKEVSAEFRVRLEAQGYAKVEPFGWILLNELNTGLRLKAIVEDGSGGFLANRAQTADGRDAYTIWEQWRKARAKEQEHQDELVETKG